MSLNIYEIAADGSEFDEVWVNQVAEALGRIPNVSINPINSYDYVFWRSDGGSGGTYYAKNNATGVVTSNAACHTLVNGLLANRKTYYFVGHTFPLTGAINTASYTDLGIYGNPKRGTIFQPADTVNAFELDETWWSVFKDFKIDGGNQTTSGMGIMFTEATGTDYSCRNHFKNIEFEDGYIGIGDLNTQTNEANTNLFEDLKLTDMTFTDIRLSVNGTGFWWLNRVIIDHWATQCSDTYSFRVDGADGVVMDQCSLLMGGATSKGGAHIENTDFIWMSNCDMEQTGLSGWVFDHCRFGQINNLRMHQSSMDGTAVGEANLALLGCTDFNFTNTSLNINTGATNSLIHVLISGATESDRINFHGGHLSNSAGYGAAISDTSVHIKFFGVDFYDNTGDDIFEDDTTDVNTYKGCHFPNSPGLTFIGEANSYDQFVRAFASLDLSGGATDIDVFFATVPCALAGYKIFYTEASSVNVGVDIRIGRYQDGVALDDNYFDNSTSEVSKNLGYAKFFDTTALTNQLIASGDVVTVGTAGGKVGTGEVRLILSIIEQVA